MAGARTPAIFRIAATMAGDTNWDLKGDGLTFDAEPFRWLEKKRRGRLQVAIKPRNKPIYSIELSRLIDRLNAN